MWADLKLAPTVRAAQPKHENMARKVPRSYTKRQKSGNRKIPRNRPSDTRICITQRTGFESELHACLIWTPELQYVSQTLKMYDLPKICTMYQTCSCLQLFTMDFLEHGSFNHACTDIRTRTGHNLSPNEWRVPELWSKNRPNCQHLLGSFEFDFAPPCHNFSCVV